MTFRGRLVLAATGAVLVVVVLGFVLMQEIAQNIVTGKEKSAANVASVGLATAQATAVQSSSTCSWV